MFKFLKKLFPGATEPSRPRLAIQRTSNMGDEGLMTSINLDNLDESDQRGFRQAFSEEMGISFFEGHVEHGYSLSFAGTSERCPRCEAPTTNQYANFIYATEKRMRVVMAPAGYFCTKCPTMVVDEEIVRKGVSNGIEYHGVLGVDYEDAKPPDFLETWNGERTIYIIGEDENVLGIATEGELSYDSPHRPASSHKRIEKERRRSKIAKESRKKNRRKR